MIQRQGEAWGRAAANRRVGKAPQEGNPARLMGFLGPQQAAGPEDRTRYASQPRAWPGYRDGAFIPCAFCIGEADLLTSQLPPALLRWDSLSLESYLPPLPASSGQLQPATNQYNLVTMVPSPGTVLAHF